MFRRSKIKITPKIPQVKSNGDRVNDSLPNGQTSTNLDATNVLSTDEQISQQNVKENNPTTFEPSQPETLTSSPALLEPLSGQPNQTSSPPTQPPATTTTTTTTTTARTTATTIIEPVNELSQQQNQQQPEQPDQTSSPPPPAPAPPPAAPPAPAPPSSSSSTTTTITTTTTTTTSPIIRDKLQDDSSMKPRKRIKISKKDLLDRSSITLYHLIHAPISRAKRTDKKKDKEKKSNDELGDENVEKNSESGESKEAKSINEDTMDSIITNASSASTIVTNEPAGSDIGDELREKESIGPRVKVGPDGELIIDEESLVIKKPKTVETETIEEPAYGKTTYSSFRKRPPTARWSKTETIEFYAALNLIGPDFSLMSNLFFNRRRTRTDLKNKFRRENKQNKSVIDKALYEADVEYCLAREAVQADHS